LQQFLKTGLIDHLQAKIFIFATIAKKGVNDHLQAKLFIFATIAVIDHESKVA
jgi:hypothetical protein